MNHYVVRIERIARSSGGDVKVYSYLFRGGEVPTPVGATHFVAPCHAYDALDAYGSKIARKSMAERKAMFMEVYDLRGPKVDRKEYIAHALQQAMNTPLQQPDGLSGRELQFIAMRLQGKKPAQIAAELGISIHTISTFQCRLKEKLGLPDTNLSLALYAVKLGMS